MQIDWLTVAAQWLNFLLLMWLLQRFLYKPIVRAMDKRQQSIATQIAEAAAKTQTAEQLAENYRNKLSELDGQKNVLLAAAREAADQERDKLAAQARAEIETLSQQWRQTLQREQNDSKQRIKQALAQWATATAQRALQDLCSMDMQQALLGHFLQRLQNISPENRQQLSDSAADGMTVASSFQLDSEQCKRIETAIHTLLQQEIDLTFQTLTDSCCGMVLLTSACTLEWRMEHYFTELDAELGARLALDEAHSGTPHV